MIMRQCTAATCVHIFLYISYSLIVWLRFVKHLLNYYLRTYLLCKPLSMKDERLVSKVEGKTNYLRHLKQFDGLARLTPTPMNLPQICVVAWTNKRVPATYCRRFSQMYRPMHSLEPFGCK